MLLFSGVQKIHVCAPSNMAVDEIVRRVSEKGLIGVTRDNAELKKLLLRIGAPSYKPVPKVMQHTLDERLNEKLMNYFEKQK